jgi:hypothetical protein
VPSVFLASKLSNEHCDFLFPCVPCLLSRTQKEEEEGRALVVEVNGEQCWIVGVGGEGRKVGQFGWKWGAKQKAEELGMVAGEEGRYTPVRVA